MTHRTDSKDVTLPTDSKNVVVLLCQPHTKKDRYFDAPICKQRVTAAGRPHTKAGTYDQPQTGTYAGTYALAHTRAHTRAHTVGHIWTHMDWAHTRHIWAQAHMASTYGAKP